MARFPFAEPMTGPDNQGRIPLLEVLDVRRTEHPEFSTHPDSWQKPGSSQLANGR
jgi:hypothetical protein